MTQQGYTNFLLQAERAEERALYRADAERVLLICILRKPELIEGARQAVTPEMFTQDDHRKLYKIMLYVYQHFVLDQGMPLSFDKYTICMIADRIGEKYGKRFRESPDGLRFLEGLERSAHAFNPNDFGKYVLMVRDAYLAVQSYRSAGDWRRQLLAKQAPPSEIARQYEIRASQYAAHDTSAGDAPRSMREVANRFHVMHDMEYKTPGLQTQFIPIPNFPGMNYYLGGGAHRSNIITVAARAKTGKTSLLLSMAIEVALAQMHSGYFDNEMTHEEFYTRMLAYFSGVKEEDILTHRYRRMGPEVFYQVERARGEVAKIFENFHYYSTQGDPPEVVASKIRKFHDEHVGYDAYVFRGTEYRVSRKAIIFYDWIKLDSDAVGNNWSEHQALGELLTTFKKSITRLGLPMICGAQSKQEMVKIVGAQDRSKVAGASAAMSDRINWFSSTICELSPLSDEEAEAVGEKFPRRTWTDPYDAQIENLDLNFNQLMQIGLNRKGQKCLYGLPMWHFLGRYRYFDMHSNETLDFLRKRFRQRRESSKAGGRSVRGQHQGAAASYASPSAPPMPVAQPVTPASITQAIAQIPMTNL